MADFMGVWSGFKNLKNSVFGAGVPPPPRLRSSLAETPGTGSKRKASSIDPGPNRHAKRQQRTRRERGEDEEQHQALHRTASELMTTKASQRRYGSEPLRLLPLTGQGDSGVDFPAVPKIPPRRLSSARPDAPTKKPRQSAGQWKNKPTQEAWRYFKRYINYPHTSHLARTSIRDSDLKEPEYACRHAEIRDGIWLIMDKSQELAKNLFNFEFADTTANRDILVTECFQKLWPETIKIIGNVASGGPEGTAGWRKLFFDAEKRKALVIAIIGNVLVEQVFQHPFFGGRIEDVKKLGEIEAEHHKGDGTPIRDLSISDHQLTQPGFDRKKLYAEYIRERMQGSSLIHVKLPTNFEGHVQQVVVALLTHLAPILYLSTDNETLTDIQASLGSIVTHAGLLSLLMQIDPYTVYYMTPVLKEDTFSRKYMECFNEKQMLATNPRDRVWSVGTPEAEKRRAQGDEALNQILLMDGLTAYRRGGWETPDSQLLSPTYQEKDGEIKGIRTRILTHGWVYCRWRRPRKFANGRPKDDHKAHGPAWKGGFVKFEDMPGVSKKDKRRATQ
jgi:hypothetical protein